MKIEITDTGWKETTEIKIIKITEKKPAQVYLALVGISFMQMVCFIYTAKVVKWL